jgi:hypothetical protein
VLEEAGLPCGVGAADCAVPAASSVPAVGGADGDDAVAVDAEDAGLAANRCKTFGC